MGHPAKGSLEWIDKRLILVFSVMIFVLILILLSLIGCLFLLQYAKTYNEYDDKLYMEYIRRSKLRSTTNQKTHLFQLCSVINLPVFRLNQFCVFFLFKCLGLENCYSIMSSFLLTAYPQITHSQAWMTMFSSF